MSAPNYREIPLLVASGEEFNRDMLVQMARSIGFINIHMARDGLHNARIVAVNVAEKAHDEIRFANLRAQIWWEIGRINCERRLWDLSTMENGDTTCAQLLAPRWTTDTKGRILIERKDDVIARLGRSPDNADALLLAFYTPKGDLTGWFDQLVKTPVRPN